jgi:hypothetical protein
VVSNFKFYTHLEVSFISLVFFIILISPNISPKHSLSQVDPFYGTGKETIFSGSVKTGIISVYITTNAVLQRLRY